MKGATWPDDELTNDVVRSRIRLASFTFVLAKTGVKYVCFTQKRLDYNILVILIDVCILYIDQNKPGCIGLINLCSHSTESAHQAHFFKNNSETWDINF